MTVIEYIEGLDSSVEVTFIENENNQIEVIYTQTGAQVEIINNLDEEPVINEIEALDDVLEIEYVAQLDPRVEVLIDNNIVEYIIGEMAIYKFSNSSYSTDFEISDWVLTGGGYYLDITHNLKSLNVIEKVMDDQYNKLLVDSRPISINVLRLFVPTNLRFKGNITIKI